MIKSHGNDQAVALLEHVLAEAKEGRMGHVSVTWGTLPHRDDEPAVFKGAIRGDTRLQGGAVIAMRNLFAQLEREVENNTLPETSEMSKDFVVFDGACGPMCFDICSWLIERKMEMLEAGLPGPMKVAFFLGHNGKVGADSPERRRFLEAVYRPMLSLIGAVEDPRALAGHTKKFYLPKGIVERYKAGQEVPKFRSSHETMVEVYQWLRDRKRPIVITLRESDHWPHRNSNLEAWTKFAGDLRAEGHSVILVRDTAKAYHPAIEDFDDCPRASTDLAFRFGLYEASACCFFVSNGPHMLTVYSDIPYIVFIQLQPDGFPYEPDTPRFWKQKFGVHPGDQFPWARPDQHIAWGPDTYENLVTAWKIFNEPVREAAE